MAQIKPEWITLDEFTALAARLVEKYPERYSGVDADQIIAYACTNKDKPERKTRPYDMSGEMEPESFTNSKQYFVKVFKSDWDARTEEQQLTIISSVLERVDVDNPGKIRSDDHKDQCVMIRTFGIDWQDRNDLPHLLRDDVEFKD